MAHVRLQELILQLETIRLQHGGSLEVLLDTDGVNLVPLDALATPIQNVIEVENEPAIERRSVVLTSFFR